MTFYEKYVLGITFSCGHGVSSCCSPPMTIMQQHNIYEWYMSFVHVPPTIHLLYHIKYMALTPLSIEVLFSEKVQNSQIST